MTELSSLPGYLVFTPIAVIGASFLLSRFLRLSALATMVGVGAPLGMPHLDTASLPLLKDLTAGEQIMAGWGLFFAAALFWVITREILRSAAGPFGLVRLVYGGLLVVALLVVGLLLFNPTLLMSYAPGWKDLGGWVLLTASLLGVVFACVRLLRSASALLVWSFASVVLASEILFGKLPHDLGPEEWRHIERIQDRVAQGAAAHFAGARTIVNP